MRMWFWKQFLLKTVQLQKVPIHQFLIGESRLWSLRGPRHKVLQQLIPTTIDRHSWIHLCISQYPRWARLLFLMRFCIINLIPLLTFLNCIIVPKIIKNSGYLGEFNTSKLDHTRETLEEQPKKKRSKIENIHWMNFPLYEETPQIKSDSKTVS